ncbi:MAG: HDIG domain-containing protein [Deltaproteobacteria bacterium]|jgi:putative nucleotidyltransferase with HDIG domain|nr:HDIG domain-containing protein [Deltaproteobacteria bacterium]
MIDRDAALKKLREYKPDGHQLDHALNSEAIMRALAPRFGGDPDTWGLAGLLHDIDFPLTSADYSAHGLKAVPMLREIDGMTDEIIQAVQAHNYEYTGVEPASPMDLALRPAETVTGLIHSAALMRPTGLAGMEPRSIKKKMKDKNFAAAVSRDRIRECEKIGLSLEEFLEISISAMTERT